MRWHMPEPRIEPEEGRVIAICARCRGEIYEGDDDYLLTDEPLCCWCRVEICQYEEDDLYG